MEIRYINPFIDYGFKKLFATEGNKDILISFLNAVIEDAADPIVDLTYKNVELIGDFNGTLDRWLRVLYRLWGEEECPEELDIYNQLEGGRILGFEQGREEGRELGLAFGEAKSKRETAQRMLSMGMGKETILQATGLTEEELSAFLKFRINS